MERQMFVIGNSFKPFSMQEMLVPFQLYKDAFDKTEAAYAELSDKADAFKYLSDTLPEGSKSRDIYEGYANGLAQQAEDLAHNGLSMSNRRALASYKRRYAGEIGRLSKADALRALDIEEQRKIALQDPTRLFARDASLSTLDDYLDGQRKANPSYSGAMLAQQVGTATAALAKSLSDYGNGKSLDKYTKTWIEDRGFTPAQVMQAIQDPTNSNSNPVIKAIVDGVLDSSGINSWGDAVTKQRAMQYANQGLWNGVGQRTVHTHEDYGERLNAANQAKGNNNVNVSGVNLGEPDSEVLTVFNNSEIPKLNKYFVKNSKGFYSMKNNKGLSEQFGGVSPFIYDTKDKKWRYKTESEMASALGKKYTPTTTRLTGGLDPNLSAKAGAVREDSTYTVLLNRYKEFRNLMTDAGVDMNAYRFSDKSDKTGTPYYSTNTNRNINDVYLGNAPMGYVNVGLSRLRLNNSSSNAVKNYMKGHAANVFEIKDVSSTKGKRTYNTVSKSVDVDYLKDNNTVVSELLYDPDVHQIIATIDDKRYTVPIGILPVDEQRNIQQYSYMLKHPEKYNNGKSWSQQDIAGFMSLMNNALMRSFQVYGTHDSTTSDYNYK